MFYPLNPEMWKERFVPGRILDLSRKIGIKWWRQVPSLLVIKMMRSEGKPSIELGAENVSTGAATVGPPLYTRTKLFLELLAVSETLEILNF